MSKKDRRRYSKLLAHARGLQDEVHQLRVASGQLFRQCENKYLAMRRFAKTWKTLAASYGDRLQRARIVLRIVARQPCKEMERGFMPCIYEAPRCAPCMATWWLDFDERGGDERPTKAQAQEAEAHTRQAPHTPRPTHEP